MSSSDRRAFLTGLAALGLAGCGFAPVHGPGGSGAALRGAVLAHPPRDRRDFDFVARIEDRLGRPSAPRFGLDYAIATEPVGSGVRPEGTITRFTLTGHADYALTELATGRTISSGRAESFTSWSATGSTVATLAAEEDARRRLMVILADQVVARLMAAGIA
ncbi:MAG: LPS assembly lipoprotein LptE [Gemmobacter sp.]